METKNIYLCACGKQATKFNEEYAWCDDCAEEADAKAQALID